MNDKSQVEYILEDIKTIVDNVIIKLTNKAEEYETTSIKREADRYVTAYMEKDTFDSYRSYPIDVLVNAGFTDINIIIEYSNDKTKIPRNKRNDVLKAMRKQIIDEYTELNDYYRELIGKPSIETLESDYIYLSEEEMRYFDIDEVRPIHEYPMEIQLKLERTVIPNLIKLHPEKTYLKHMGSKSVDLVRARNARNYEIIFTDVRLDSVFMRAFFDTYNFCREYFMSMIYNKQFKARYDLYDNYIGMHIMIMTVQRLIVDTIKLCIDRDFYDIISIKKLFDVYGLPFFEDLPLDYQRLICKNVNWLLRCKSTDKVLYDVANTLFYERIEIHKYYLIKDRKYDELGNPIFKYKYIATDDESETPDYYLKCNTTGIIYKLAIMNGELTCIKFNPILDNIITIHDSIYMKDNKGVNYEITVNNGVLTKHYYNKPCESMEEILLYDKLNTTYVIYIYEGDFIIDKIIVDSNNIDYDTSIYSHERTYILNDEGKVYEIYIAGDRLVTREAEQQSDKVDYVIRIYNDDNGEKALLYMINDQLRTSPVYDDQPADILYLYNEKFERYKITTVEGKLQSFECVYKLKKEIDYESMFNVYFQSMDIMENNIAGAIEQKKFRYSYNEVTSGDVYWWETDELKKELYSREYNYIDTKYIGVNVMQNLTKLLYETSYYLNLLIDHKDTTVPIYYRILNSDAMKTGTDYLYIVLDRITSTPISIFDTIMILCALISKKNGMKGNIILKSPAQMLSVLGFNFEINFDLIRNNIKKYKKIFKNQNVLNYLDLLDIQKVSDIDILFNNFKNFAEFCEDVIANTNDIDEYKAYKELYKVITVRKDSRDLFLKSDGELASTYMDYLYDKLPGVAEFLESIHKDDTGIYIEHAIGKLNELVPEIEYLYSMNGSNNNIINAIIGLINFFKSYTVDLRNLNVMYMFDNKRMNKIYMIDDNDLFINLFPNEFINRYSDTILYRTKFDENDNLIVYQKTNNLSTFTPQQKFITEHKLNISATGMEYNDTIELDYNDVVTVYNQFGEKELLCVKDYRWLIERVFNNDRCNIIELMNFNSRINNEDILRLFYNDNINCLVNKNFYNDNLKEIKDDKSYYVEITNNPNSTRLELLDNIKIIYEE